ncbi:MAG: hypothetical protein IIC67_07065 [Thaumarchaeota archaeon]|nr:hypothetical protein [Nitrososphaerota archaeon]
MNKKHLIIAIVGFSLFILGMTFVIPGGSGDVEHIDSSTLSHYENCVRSSGEKGWNEEENSCLFFTGSIDQVESSIDSCNRKGGHMKGDVQYSDLQDKNNTAFIECQFPIEPINDT